MRYYKAVVNEINVTPAMCFYLPKNFVIERKESIKNDREFYFKILLNIFINKVQEEITISFLLKDQDEYKTFISMYKPWDLSKMELGINTKGFTRGRMKNLRQKIKNVINDNRHQKYNLYLIGKYEFTYENKEDALDIFEENFLDLNSIDGIKIDLGGRHKKVSIILNDLLDEFEFNKDNLIKEMTEKEVKNYLVDKKFK